MVTHALVYSVSYSNWARSLVFCIRESGMGCRGSASPQGRVGRRGITGGFIARRFRFPAMVWSVDSEVVAPLVRSELITENVKSEDPAVGTDPAEPAGPCRALAGTEPDVVGAGSCAGNEPALSGMWITISLDSSFCSFIFCQKTVGCECNRLSAKNR